MAEPAERSDSVVDRDDHHAVTLREVPPVIEHLGSDHVAAAVNPEEDRHEGVTTRNRGGIRVRRVDVEVQTVLVAEDLSLLTRNASEQTRELRAEGARIQ